MVFKRKPRADGKRRRFSPLLWLASLGAILALVLGITGTLSQFQASITNTNNHLSTLAAANQFQWSESNPGAIPGGTRCTLGGTHADGVVQDGQNATCTDINKFAIGGDGLNASSSIIAAGATHTAVVGLNNEAVAGGIPGDVRLRIDTCTGDLCPDVTLTVTCTGPGAVATPIATTALSALPAGPTTVATGVGPGASVVCTFTTHNTLTTTPSPAITATQQIQWLFTQSGLSPVTPLPPLPVTGP